MTYKTLTEAVKQKRKTENLTLKQFGVRYDISFQTLSKIENDKWRFSIAYAEKICSKLSIEMIVKYKIKDKKRRKSFF